MLEREMNHRVSLFHGTQHRGNKLRPHQLKWHGRQVDCGTKSPAKTGDNLHEPISLFALFLFKFFKKMFK